MSTNLIASSPPEDSDKKIRVLFFGGANCEASKEALNHLNALGCEVTAVESKVRGERPPKSVQQWDGEYILCFRSFYVLPADLIARAKIGAVNFHPAPPEYPGSGSINLALYDGALEFGVTAHLMNEKVDNGEILECRRFPTLPSDSVDSLSTRTRLILLDLFFDVVTELILGGRRAIDQKVKQAGFEKWKGEATKISVINRMQNIPVNISQEELERIIRATYTENFPPYVELFGYQFFLKFPNKRDSL